MITALIIVGIIAAVTFLAFFLTDRSLRRDERRDQTYSQWRQDDWARLYITACRNSGHDSSTILNYWVEDK